MKKIKWKMLLDIVLVIIWILLMRFRVTTLNIHELLGLGIIALFITHNLLNLDWIKKVTKNMLYAQTDLATKCSYIVDILLAILALLTGISGVLISRTILTQISVSNQSTWEYLHKVFAYTCLIMISIHIGLHINFIMALVRKKLKIQRPNRVRNILLKSAALLIAIAGIKSSVENNLAGVYIPRIKNDVNHVISSDGTSVSSSTVDGENEDTAFTTDSAETTVSLDDYLGGLICTGCHNMCPLTLPRCGTGVSQAIQAEEYYNTSIVAEGTKTDSVIADNMAATDTVTQVPDNIQTIVVEDTGGGIADLFKDIVPIMGLYAAGTYYILKIVKSRKKLGDRECR